MEKRNTKYTSKRRGYYLLVLTISSLFLFACNNKQESSSDIYSTSQDTIVNYPDINRTVSVAKIGVDKIEQFGQYLTDANGRTLYMFTGDAQGKSSSCYLNCSEVWPPLLTTDLPVAVAPAINEKLLGTIVRHDGSLQVTYNGWPLYYYRKDKGPGLISGQDVNGFGGDWYIIAPNGSPIAPESSKDQNSRG